jgi:acyl carrier protein
MSPTSTRQEILVLLARIAPEADLAALPGDVSLRDELDIDSIDLLNFAIAVSQRFSIDIPQADMPHLATLDGCVAYVDGVLANRRSR